MRPSWHGGCTVSKFSIGSYHEGTVIEVYSERHEIELDPEYQRISDVWTTEKRQLLIDSMLNGFDIPKIYFHEFVPFKEKNSLRYRYAIIDGKQRLQTIWNFIDGRLPLADDFKYIGDDAVEAGGLTYAQLASLYPRIKNRFDGRILPIVTIRTDDIDMIEDMFSRLNEAVPLNAPEKRNALGGPMPREIRRVAEHTFFKKNVPFPDNRYRHRDMAAKFLFLEYSNGIASTKKVNLDSFVKNFKAWQSEGRDVASPNSVCALRNATQETMALLNSAFRKRDPLLRQVGMITLYYYLFRFMKLEKVDRMRREMFEAFDTARQVNRALVEKTNETHPDVDSQLLTFDRHSQTPNDAYALRDRLGIILGYLKEHNQVGYNETILRAG